MDDSIPQKTVSQSKRDDELEKAFVSDLIEQPKQLDKLARVLLILSFVLPLFYALGLKFFTSTEGTETLASGSWLIVLAFSSWFVSLLLSLFALLSGKTRRDPAAQSRVTSNKGKPVTVEALYLASARSKRRRLLASSLFCFTGICFAGLTVFSAAFPGISSMQSPANFVHLTTPQSAILSAVIFNALIIIALIPLSLFGVPYRPMAASRLLRDNLLIYGVGGIIAPFAGIKLIDMILVALRLV